tara:strand:+ start:136 stop:558 length:423 start_codon:yes stop_codon:yes gene_type:complete
MWFFYCLLSAMAIGMSGVLYKYKLKVRTKDIVLVSCMSHVILAILSFCYLCMVGGYDKQAIYRYLDWPFLTILLLFSIGIVMFDYSLLKSSSPTLHTALYAGAKIVFVLLVSYMAFNDILTKWQMLSVGVILLGLVLMSM